MEKYIQEIVRFVWANAQASYFGGFLLFLLLFTYFAPLPLLHRYDWIFIGAVFFQCAVLLGGFERLREFLVIFLFHIVATVMELFKTLPQIGSWLYPDVHSAVFVIGGVPLFAGFMYSAVGSYISRAFIFLELRYEHFPQYFHLWIVASLIYINFFTHHFFYDIRYIIFLYVFTLFYKTTVTFRVYKKIRKIPFLLSALLTAFFVWIAENIATYSHTWLYPSQELGWHLVSIGKMGSWFLLLVLSFALVSIVYRNRLQ